MSSLFTQEQIRFILQNYKGISSKELTERLNNQFSTHFKESQLRSFKSNNKLRSGYNSKFKKGITPLNKGKTWDEYMSKEGQANSRKTQFKKSEQPVNTKPIGSERICSKDGYVLVKVSDEGPSQKQWQAKHRIVWEAAHGPIPEGHRLLLLDGNPANYHLDNLKLVTYKVGAVMNKQGLHIKGDKEMNEAGSLIAELIIKNNTFKKGNINEN